MAGCGKAKASLTNWVPLLGLFINASKCELFSLSDLSLFPSQMKSNMPHIEILGAQIGDAIFCAKLVADKRTRASKLLLLLMEVGTMDPHVVSERFLQAGFSGYLPFLLGKLLSS